MQTIIPGAADGLINKSTRLYIFWCKIGCLFCKTLIFNVPCGEIGIRTRDTILSYTRFPGVPLKPLEHLSNDIRLETGANIGIIFRIRKKFNCRMVGPDACPGFGLFCCSFHFGDTPDFVADMVRRQRARWRLKMLSIGRDFAGFLRPSVFSKCHRAHFCRKIVPVGRDKVAPTGTAIQKSPADMPTETTGRFKRFDSFQGIEYSGKKMRLASRKNKKGMTFTSENSPP